MYKLFQSFNGTRKLGATSQIMFLSSTVESWKNLDFQKSEVKNLLL